MPRGPSSSRSGNRPLYAIDFTAVACGKRIANTKRRVRWRFGFANPDALASGETGTACRGEEHDVTMVWSVTSGKRLVLCDGKEVHYSNSRSAVIDFSWTMRGNHVLKVVCHATAPMSAEPGFRQYDFFVDGRSFFSFPKVYRLGLTGDRTMSPNSSRASPQRSGGGRQHLAESSGRRNNQSGGGDGGSIAQIEAPHNPDEEEAYLREAIKASLATEAKRSTKSPEKPKMSAEATDLLIDFMDDFDAGNAAPAPAAGVNEWALAPAPQQNNQWAAPPPPAENNWAMSPQPPAPAPVQQPAYGGYAAAPANPFTPAPVQPVSAPAPVQNFAAPPAADPFASPAFAPPAPPAPMATPQFTQPPAAQVAADPFAPAAPVVAPTPATNGAALSMNCLTNDSLLGGGSSAAPTDSGTLADKALQNLMGSIDSFGITGAAAKPPAANNPFDSNNIMSNATLGEMKSSKSTEKKPVMNAPQGGALVMTNNQGGNWGGYAQQTQQNTSQYGGMGGMGVQQQAPPQYSMSGGYTQQQPQMGYGQQPPMQQQPMMGQQPPMQQQGYGAPPHGQQPPMQQNQWGAPSY